MCMHVCMRVQAIRSQTEGERGARGMAWTATRDHTHHSDSENCGFMRSKKPWTESPMGGSMVIMSTPTSRPHSAVVIHSARRAPDQRTCLAYVNNLVSSYSTIPWVHFYTRVAKAWPYGRGQELNSSQHAPTL